jgi:hypothetical protein
MRTVLTYTEETVTEKYKWLGMDREWLLCLHDDKITVDYYAIDKNGACSGIWISDRKE